MTDILAIVANVIIFSAAAYFFGLWAMIPIGASYLVGLLHAHRAFD